MKINQDTKIRELLEKTQLYTAHRELLMWYDQNKRILPWRSSPTPYHVWVSEIMLQQTRVQAVKGYYDRFMEALPDIASLARADEEQLHKLWEGLGYYNRIRNMHKAAKLVMERYHGELPDSYEALLSLPGIGEYTAGAVASIAFGQKAAAVDGNVLRILTRMTACDEDILQPAVKRMFQELVLHIQPEERPGDFNQALMELGATVCVPNGPPQCESCPVAGYCLGQKQGTPQVYPVKSPKKPRKQIERTVCILLCRDKVYLTKRPDQGLLPGLWEFYCLDGWYDKEEITAHLMEKGAACTHIYPLKKAKHIFTHIEWQMQGYLIQVDRETPHGNWVTKQELEDQYALPSAYRMYSNVLKNWL
ncbi:A/G-specific adenine glycosylase [Candidatus Soleaferrea massiliensis]|uniref:A/G-specific adenine glycosylase n=1 Tax=Candidatus Soleaferrea massiliensis TaxID=1470354 RepID=UPI0005909BDD|nr:A/G-specific adenine glycosylase [Candidatus Soleaferrea massiliensis]